MSGNTRSTTAHSFSKTEVALYVIGAMSIIAAIVGAIGTSNGESDYHSLREQAVNEGCAGSSLPPLGDYAPPIPAINYICQAVMPVLSWDYCNSIVNQNCQTVCWNIFAALDPKHDGHLVCNDGSTVLPSIVSLGLVASGVALVALTCLFSHRSKLCNCKLPSIAHLGGGSAAFSTASEQYHALETGQHDPLSQQP